MDIMVVGNYCNQRANDAKKISNRIFSRKLRPQIYIVQVYVLDKNKSIKTKRRRSQGQFNKL